MYTYCTLPGVYILGYTYTNKGYTHTHVDTHARGHTHIRQLKIAWALVLVNIPSNRHLVVLSFTNIKSIKACVTAHTLKCILYTHTHTLHKAHSIWIGSRSMALNCQGN